MTFLDHLERRFARFAIPGLIRYVVAFNALVFVLISIEPGYASYLTLNRDLILQGQIWRLVSWIFIPGVNGALQTVLFLLVAWWTGNLLESAWGTFRFNAYYFTGMFLCVLSAFLFGDSGGNVLLNLSIFFALATLAPNLEILFFFVIPMKLKWVALISLIGPLAILILGSLSAKMMVVTCLGNYLIFFGPQFLRRAHDRRTVAARRSQFEAAKSDDPSLHRCEVCGVTEITDPHADFRVTSDGREFCTKHLPSARQVADVAKEGV